MGAGRTTDARLRAAQGLEVERVAVLEDRELPAVSVVIVNLNGRALLEPCLEALYASDFPLEKLDVVVADNASKDDSLAFLAARHPRVRRLQLPRNLGFTAACNAGIFTCTASSVLVLLNNDVVVSRSWLRELVSPVAARRCAATAARILLPDGAPEFLGGGQNFQGFGLGHPLAEDLIRATDVPRRCLFACGGAMAVDRRIYLQVGGLDSEYFAYYDDADLGWRLWLHGHEVHYVPSAECHHARSSTSRRFPPEQVRLIQTRNALASCVKNYGDATLDRVLPAILALATRRLWITAGGHLDGDYRIERHDPSSPSPERAIPQPIPRLAFADLLASNDVLGRWEHWMKKRAEVQSRRRRGDEQILPLFLEPLWCTEQDPAYQALQLGLVQRFRLDELFDSARA